MKTKVFILTKTGMNNIQIQQITKTTQLQKSVYTYDIENITKILLFICLQPTLQKPKIYGWAQHPKNQNKKNPTIIIFHHELT